MELLLALDCITGDATQALVSNCIFSTEFTASIVMKIVPIARTLIMTTDTTHGRRELSFIYNDVSIMYCSNGNHAHESFLHKIDITHEIFLHKRAITQENFI